MGTISTAKDAAKLAFQHRKAIKNGDFTPFIPALAMALAKDSLFDPLSAIPIAGLVPEMFGIFIAVYLFIFLWGKGKWKVRLAIFFLNLFDLIPVVSVIPLSTISVLYAFYQARRDAGEAKKSLASVEGLVNVLSTREYQEQYARAEEAQAAQNMEQNERQEAQQPTQSRTSMVADYVPVVGSTKMMAEAVRGKQYGGRELRGMDRVRHGAAGAGMLAADLTGVGEAARLGKLGMAAVRIGEHEAAEVAARQAFREGTRLHERGKQRRNIQNQGGYRPAHNVV